MKKLAILLATSALIFSPISFSANTNPNDVLQTVPGAAQKIDQTTTVKPSVKTKKTRTVNKSNKQSTKKKIAAKKPRCQCNMNKTDI